MKLSMDLLLYRKVPLNLQHIAVGLKVGYLRHEEL